MTPPRGVLLGAYRAATIAFGAVSGAYLQRRLDRGKEDPARLGERMGHAGRPRPAGGLVWLHGASVGEGLALLPLVARLVARGLAVLVTTGTVTSARILAERLPAGAFHQFIPLDIPRAMRRFLDHWQPDLCLLAESELWPNLIAETARRGVPLVLINARLSARSFTRWRRLPRLIGPLLGAVDLCLAQSAADAERLAALGAAHVAVAGNLKFDAEPPPGDAVLVDTLARAIGRRAVWLAASTHPDEEAAILDVHRRTAAAHPDLLTIIVPRKTDRGPGIAAQAATMGIVAALRSRADPIEPGTALHIADTMGEVGVFYRLAPIVFVGKSLGGGGGQNPIEPAKLGCAILHGPNVANFADVYRLFDEAGGAIAVADAGALALSLAQMLDAPAVRAAVATAAAAAAEAGSGATDWIMRALEPFLADIPHTAIVR